jgi:hypothetical protein
MKAITKLNKISELAFAIQDKELATMFLRYSGHTNEIDVTLYPGKYNFDYAPENIIYFTIYCDNNGDKTHNDLKYFKLINYLENILLTEIIEKP